MFTNLNELKNAALEVNRSDKEQAYCSKFEVVAFVIDGYMYAVPWSKTAIAILADSGFRRRDLLIPYGRDLVSVDKEDYWNKLVKDAAEERLG